MAKVLVVDDDPDIRELISEFLKSAGHQTVQSPNALAALDDYDKEHPDLVICDFNMPDMDGADFFLEVNGYQNCCPFIFISGYTEKLSLSQSYTLIKKPVEYKVLMAEVNRALGAQQKIQCIDSYLGRILLVIKPIGHSEELYRCLTQFGYEHVQCSQGKKALSLLDEGAFDLVITDSQLDDMNGFEFLENMKKTPGGSNIPAVMITEVSQLTIAQKALNLGAIDILSRPFNRVNLEYQLHNIFSIFVNRQPKQEDEGLNILLVDSSPESIKALDDFCGRDHRTLKAQTVEEALSHIQDHQPDVTIVSFRIAGQSGLSLVKTIKKTYPESLNILLTEQGDQEIPIEAIKVGIFDYVEKPIRFQLLQRAIENAKQHINLKKRLEDSKGRAQESERMAAIGTMSGTFAHEIANPISIISGNVHVLKTLLKGSPLAKEDPRISTCADKIDHAVVRVSRLIRSLRNLSRNQRETELGEEWVGNIIDDAIGLCEHRLNQYQIELIPRTFAKDLKVVCSRVEISQVLVNLINNACHAMENTPEKKIDIDVQRKGDGIVIKVKDSGTGIPEDIQDKIFDPFFTTKPVDKGTGLGLSTCKRLVESFEGELSFDSSPNGTTFLISLPTLKIQKAG